MIVLSVIAPGQELVLLKEISSLETDVGPGDHITHQLKEAYYATSDKDGAKFFFIHEQISLRFHHIVTLVHSISNKFLINTCIEQISYLI